MGSSFSGAQNVNNNDVNYYNVTKNSLTYDGLFNENYFKISSQEKEFVTNVELSHSITQHPITQKKEKYIGILCKSKYDGFGINEQIDVSIAIDASASMLALTNSGVGNNKSEFAKETAKRIINQLHDQDNIAVTYFGVESHVYIPLTPKSEIPKEKIEKMKKGIKCQRKYLLLQCN